jgi:hypothetical protein
MAYALRSSATHDNGPSIDGLHTGPLKKELSVKSWLDERISLSLEVTSECRHLGSKLNEFFDFYEKDITAGRAVLISSVDDHYPHDTEFDYFVQEHKTLELAAIPSACMSCRSANEDCTGIPCSRSK